ncbi:Luminal-binding protein 4 [Symbiodinium microadriaticum]|uniref:Luminal-binding protein 4 n=1 Tax=Symbiodinium microadriaticum TaxID=2951 RepID=A0A1Q9D7L2_SYMMI|nr:Luminal-binding protein 4 [Symbiodinium microadriaticum]
MQRLQRMLLPRSWSWTGTVHFALVVFLAAGLAAGEHVTVDGPVIGIDLGTTYSCAAVFKSGAVEIIPSSEGSRIMPSSVAFTPGKEVPLIGESAKDLALSSPEQTLSNVKRLIGRDYKDAGVQRDSKMMPFKVVAHSDGSAAISVAVDGQAKVLRPEEISALLLKELTDRAQKYLGREVKHAPDSQPQSGSAVSLVRRAGASAMAAVDQPRSIAIIGAGVAGLQALRALQQVPQVQVPRVRNLDRMLETQFRLDVVFELSLPNFLFCVCLILAALVELGHETWRITEIYFVEVREEAEMAWRHRPAFRRQDSEASIGMGSQAQQHEHQLGQSPPPWR